jgi:Choline/Carnitine o-acyltransferase
MKEATVGRGIDRHMLGLRSMIKPEEQDKATMFKDPAFLKSMYFKLSTSNMSPGDYFYGGFGPVVPEGYGVNYAIGKDDLKFSISNRLSGGITHGPAFRDALQRSLIDMMILFPKRYTFPCLLRQLSNRIMMDDIDQKYGDSTGKTSLPRNKRIKCILSG